MRNKWIAHASHAVLSFNCDRTVARGDDFTLHYFPTGRGVPSAPYKLSVMLAGPFALSTMNSTTYPLLWTISGNIVGVGSAPRKAVSRKSPREFVCDRHTSATNPDGNETSRTPVLLPIYWWRGYCTGEGRRICRLQRVYHGNHGEHTVCQFCARSFGANWSRGGTVRRCGQLRTSGNSTRVGLRTRCELFLLGQQANRLVRGFTQAPPDAA